MLFDTFQASWKDLKVKLFNKASVNFNVLYS